MLLHILEAVGTIVFALVVVGLTNANARNGAGFN